MAILNKKLWLGLLILTAVALFTSAAVVGGVEWALASLGAMVLAGMIGISICALTKVLRYSKSVKGGRLEYGNTSAGFCDGYDSKRLTYNKPAKAAPISKEDKRLIIEHIDELFEIGQEQSGEKLLKAGPISKEDKRLIMVHIDKLFKTDLEQSQEMLS